MWEKSFPGGDECGNEKLFVYVHATANRMNDVQEKTSCFFKIGEEKALTEPPHI